MRNFAEFMKKILIVTTFLLALASCQNEKVPSDPNKKLVVAVAANAQFAMEALKETFEKSSDAKVELVVGSSGKLTAQLLQGAPYDVFVSADMKYPDTLFRAGLTESQPAIYAYGTLVIWTCKDIDLSTGVRAVSSGTVQKIAVANPKTAPYGEETMRVLGNFKLYNSEVANKIVYGESIAQTNQYITSGNCDLGFTAKSVVMAPQMKGKGKWYEINPITYNPIAQGVVITKQGTKQHPKLSRAFVSLLLGEKGQNILAEYGYRLPNEKAKSVEE